MGKIFVFESEIKIAGTLRGWLTIPKGFNPSVESLPMIVFLHGVGERGDGSDKQLEYVKRHGIPKLFTKNPDYHGLRVITFSPQCDNSMTWWQNTHTWQQYIDDLATEMNVDRQRISITGLSMGGYGTWDLFTSYPSFYSCAAPVCGGGAVWRCDSLKGKKIWAFHGLDDPVVPYSEGLHMIESAKHFGADAKMTAIDHIGHGVWVPAYEKSGLIEWLIEQTL